MSLTIEKLTAFLGSPAKALLTDARFSSWRVERSIEKDLGLIDYTFPANGLDVVCDAQDRVESIFLHAHEARRFEEDISDLPLTLDRATALRSLGEPSKSGPGLNDPVLGVSGPWDRFTRSTYTIHLEYFVDAERIKLVTLMRNDVVP